MLKKRISSHLEGSAVKSIRSRYYGSIRSSRELFATKSTQTEFRESESQTLPWEPPYKAASEDNPPEVLDLVDFTWGHGLPAGMHELEKINRMRIKKAWERILPPMDPSTNVDVCSRLINALEADSWAFREAEIKFVMDLRLSLAEKLMQSVEELRARDRAIRFEKLDRFLISRKLREIKSIRRKFSREIRKLASMRAGKPRRRDSFCKLDPAPRFLQFASSDDLLKRIETGEELPSWLSANPPKFDLRICPRIKRRTERKLFGSMKSSLMESCETPSLQEETGLFKNNGRPAHSTVTEGRDHYRELIERLRSARGDEFMEQRIREIMDGLEGETVAKMLVFLNEELHRLQSDKRAHASALLAEGRKQPEVGDRLDEIFRKVLSINQESVETYLEDVARGGVNEEAESSIFQESGKLDMMENYLYSPNQEDKKSIYNDGISSADKRVDPAENLHDRDRSVLRVIDGVMVHAAVDDDEREAEIREILKELFLEARKNSIGRRND